jgi:hypothetical protein
MTNLQKKLEKWAASTTELIGGFAKQYFDGSAIFTKIDVFNSEVKGYSFSLHEIIQYIEAEATKEEIVEHYDYCIEHKYVRFDYWRDQIKPKTETRPVEVGVIK